MTDGKAAAGAETEKCAHCAGAMTGPAVTETTGGEGKKFCCQGCAAAFRVISGAGLGDFYRRRDRKTAGADHEVFDLRIQEEEARRFLDPENPGRLRFAVANVRCQACVWLIERILAAAPGVLDVRGNFARHTFMVEFDPEATSPARILGQLTRTGYRPAASGGDDGLELRQELVRFATAAFFTVQIMVYSLGLYAGFFQGMAEAHRRLLQFFSGLAATPVVLWCGLPFFRAAAAGLRRKTAGMDLLVASGVGAAYLYSWAAFFLGRETWFEAAAMVVTLVLLGRLVEAAGRRAALAGIERLASLAPDTVTKTGPEGVAVVPAASLVPGDIILARTGERLAADSVLVGPQTTLDTSVVNGESVPARLEPGDEAAAGCVNMGPPARFRVARRAADSFIARMNAMVEESLARKAPVQRLADRAAAMFVPVVLAVACATLACNLAQGRAAAGVLAAVAVLVVSCPCALGLATPLAVTAAVGRAAQMGVLFRSGEAVERCAGIDVVALDKTGTITAGAPVLQEIVTMDKRGPGEALRIAARAAALSTHPAARALAAAAAEMGEVPQPAGQGREFPGQGIAATAGGEKILLGSRRFLEERGAHPPAEPDGINAAASGIWLAENGVAVALFLLEDPVLAGVKESVARLAGMGIRAVILSGDREGAVREAARKAGIKEWLAGLGPDGKKAWMEEAAKSGARVLMAGDGINDAPAMAAAHVSASFAQASDIALAASAIVLPARGIGLLPWTVGLSRKTMQIVRGNLAWAFSYNLVAIPLAAAGLLAPAWAAAMMGASSLLVVANSARLRRFHQRGEAE